MRRWLVTGAALTLAAVVAVGLVLGPTTGADRVESIGQGIRCPVCQGESIADSPSTTAREMMDVVREQVAAGRSDQEILDYFTARYGRWILLDPGLTAQTVALWALPLRAAAGGIVVIRRQLAGDEPAPDGDELEQLRDRVARLRGSGETVHGQ